MKSSQPLTLIIVSVLLIGGGVYVYQHQKQTNTPVAANPTTQATAIPQTKDIIIVSPVSGEIFKAGSPITVSFSGGQAQDQYKIELFSTFMAGDVDVYDLGTTTIDATEDLHKNISTIPATVRITSMPIKGGGVGDISKNYRIRITQLTNRGSSCTYWSTLKNTDYCAQTESNYFTIVQQ